MEIFFAMPIFWMVLAIFIVVSLLFLWLPLLKNRILIKECYFVCVFSICFSLTAFFLYKHWGSSEIIHVNALNDLSRSLNALMQKKNITKEQVIAHFKNLEQKISYSHVAMNKLGNFYLELGLFKEAIFQFEKATKKAPRITEYWLSLMYSHSLYHQGKLPPEVKTLAQRWVEDHPFEYEIINLLAIDHYYQGEYSEAIHKWQYLLTQDQTLSVERQKILQNAIKLSKKHIAVSSDNIAVIAHISLSESLKNEVKSEDSIFVFIKEVDNEKASPLAVVKRKASELPFTVKLSNEQAMLMNDPFVEGKKIKVIAKISKSGDPLNKKGELRGVSKELVLRSDVEPINVVINQNYNLFN